MEVQVSVCVAYVYGGNIITRDGGISGRVKEIIVRGGREEEKGEGARKGEG